MDRSRIIIAGGGWAGLSAATALVQSGAQISLLERARDLGGRASSFYDKEFGEWLDNGPHIVIGAYRKAMELLEVWKASSGISFATGLAIPWLLPNGRTARLRLGGDHGKIGSVAGLMSFGGMSIADRLKSIRAAEALIRWPDVDLTDETTIADFLEKYGIQAGSCGGFWEALTTAVMNAPTYIAGTKPLVKAVKEGLLVGGKAAMLGLPLKPLKQLYVDPALDYLTAQGADIRCGTPVDAVVVDKSDRVSGVMVEGELLPAKGVILALPPYEVTGLIPRRWRSDPFFSRVSEFSYAPIASVHMAFDRPVLPVRFGHLPRAFTHWVFGRGRSEASGWANLSALISYAPDRAEAMVEAIGSQALEDIRDRLPEARNAKLLRLKTVRIARATVVLKPNTDRLRAVSRTPVKGLYLAGDWCQTGLPATIESAARSGDEAAKAALADA